MTATLILFESKQSFPRARYVRKLVLSLGEAVRSEGVVSRVFIVLVHKQAGDHGHDCN